MSQVQTAARAALASALAFSTATDLPAMDLSKVMKRVADENPDWPQARLDAAEASYRAFWAQCKNAPGGNRPDADTDAVWHAHLMFNGSYMMDSMAYFGYVLIHRPDDEVTAKAGRCGDGKCDDASHCADCGDDVARCSACDEAKGDGRFIVTRRVS